MLDRLPQLKPQELIRAFEKLGFLQRRQSGLLFGILKQAGILQEQLLEVL